MRRRGTMGIVLSMMVLVAGGAGAQLNQTAHTDGWVLAAAHAPGYHGSIWRTDLWIMAPDASPTSEIRLRFCRQDEDGTMAEDLLVPIPVGHKVLFMEDVVDYFLGVGEGSWVGAIHYTASIPVQVWARVYSISPDGRASYGQLVEGIPTADMSAGGGEWNPDRQQWVAALRHTADGRFRVNIGVVNPTAVEADYEIAFFDAGGNRPPDDTGVRYVTLPPYSMTQLSDPFAQAMGGEWSDVQIRVTCTTEGAGGFAYASVVDNATNDAYFVRGVKRQLPGE